jgi:NADH:ubiquinone oxidoreductase subunit 4 (subunit M)
MVAVTAAMAALIILFGVYPAPVISLADGASKALVNGLGKYIGAVLP